MKLYKPEKVIFDKRALKYPKADHIRAYCQEHNIPFEEARKVTIEGETSIQKYVNAKRVVYVTVNKQKKLPNCNPSADYRFNLSSSCPGHCEYCYLQTTQGETPYIKLFVNLDEIYDVILGYIKEEGGRVTAFECGSITDPLALEHMTDSLRDTILFFAEQPLGRLRVITKYNNVDRLLDLDHKGHTKFRFSINTNYVTSQFEHGTSSYEERLKGIKKIAEAGYPIGFIIAPIMIYDGWETDYLTLIHRVKEAIGDYNQEITFELIQHRFTKTAKELIQSRFPKSKLDMDEEKRLLKWGPYGKFKYVYPKEQSQYMKELISNEIEKTFPQGTIEYFT